MPLDQIIYDRIVGLRRELHRHPELGNQEARTAETIKKHLTELGLEYRDKIAGHGLICDIAGQNAGPMIALRADMDALPIQEETGLEFASEIDGVMHACGHDGHTSMLVGAAQLFAQRSPKLPVRLIWQPAEELGSGARAMCEAGVMQDVAMIFGGHVDRRYPAGNLVVTDGVVNASTDTFSIHIHGQQGHGARPHEAVDTVVVGSLLVTALQTIVSREVDPAYPSVVTIGTFNAGTASNVIAGNAILEGTIRSQHQKVREHLHASIRRISTSIGQLHGAKVEVEVHEGTPPVSNDPIPTRLAREAATQVVGRDAVHPLHTANMGGEDFSYYMQHAPGCYIRFGAQIKGREGFPAHSSRFDFDEASLGTGALWYEAVAREGARYLLENNEQ